MTAGQAVSFALAHLSEQLSAFPERELTRVALLHGLGGVTPEQVAAELPRRGVIVDTIGDRRMATPRRCRRKSGTLPASPAKAGAAFARSACPRGFPA